MFHLIFYLPGCPFFPLELFVKLYPKITFPVRYYRDWYLALVFKPRFTRYNRFVRYNRFGLIYLEYFKVAQT